MLLRNWPTRVVASLGLSSAFSVFDKNDDMVCPSWFVLLSAVVAVVQKPIFTLHKDFVRFLMMMFAVPAVLESSFLLRARKWHWKNRKTNIRRWRE